MRRAIAAAALVLLMSTGAPVRAQAVVETPKGDWALPDHPGVAFPETLDGYRRLQVIRYGPDNHSVSYLRREDAREALLSIYVYRTQGACADEYAGTRLALTQRFGDAEPVAETPPVAIGTVPGTARSVRFATDIPRDIGGGRGVTELWLHCDDSNGRAIKYRATSSVPGWIDEAPALIARLGLIERVRR